MSTPFGDALARHMNAHGVTVRELARQSHYSAGYISNLRNGIKSPSPECGAELGMLLGAAEELAALAAAPGDGEPVAADPMPAQLGDHQQLVLTDDVNPVEHLLRFRDQITDSDSLFGPRRLIPLVRSQLDLIRQLRRGRTGADSRELLRVQARYAETLAWQFQDVASYRKSQYWLDRALEWAHMAGDMEWAAFVLARKSQLAGDMHDPAAAIDLAEAAARLADAGRLQAASAAYQAHGHALNGEESASLTALDNAREIVDAPDPDPSASWSPWLSTEYVEAQRARCLSILGRHDQAVTWYGRAIDGTPAELRRERGVHLARKALAHAGAGDPDAAAETGTPALAILQLTGSGRISADLKRLNVSLREWRAQPSVAGFREQFASMPTRP